MIDSLKVVLDWVKSAFRSRYVLLLEEEIARLRAENRALLNSLLGTAGFPPIHLPEARQARVSPVRRRSWHQLAALREWETAEPKQAPPSSPQAGYGGGENAPPPAKGPFH